MSQVRFFSPSPLWDDLVGNPAGFRAPALLRFSGDDFIPQYQGVLAAEPRKLRGFVARPETWREPAAGLDVAPSTRYPLRLYQPVHGRFYLVAATLACRVPGLPEHTVDTARGETVAFVLRRITTAVATNGVETETGEWAWVKRADGSEGWVAAAGATLAAGEEQLPMFASSFAGTGGLRSVAMQRRVFAGLVPASRRETYAHGGEMQAQAPAPAAGSLDDPRVIDFQFQVLDPWTELKSWYDGQRYDATHLASALDSAERSSPLILLDLHDFLRDRLTPVWNVAQGTATRASLGSAYGALYDALAGTHAVDRGNANSATLVAAMNQAAAHRADIEAGTFPVPGYTSRVLIGDPRRYRNPPPLTPVPDAGGSPTAAETELATLFARLSQGPFELLADAANPGGVGVRRLKKLVMDALAAAGSPPAALLEQLPARTPAAAAAAPGDDWFAIRCVYLRPECGRKSPPVVSERSERFQLTSFFEPDAPARHLRVALPVDTSPATLRKYNRNVAFVLSDQLRRQMNRASSLKDLMDGKVGDEGGITFGVICSFSIPIITICALILLMILVSLLNIIFWWIPLFRICFPVPKAK